MVKTTNLYVRLEPGLQEQVELVLGQLGNMVYEIQNCINKTS